MWETHLSGSMRGPWRTTFMVATQVLLYLADAHSAPPWRIRSSHLDARGLHETAQEAQESRASRQPMPSA